MCRNCEFATTQPFDPPGSRRFCAGLGSLFHGKPSNQATPRRTLYARTMGGGIEVPPTPDCTVQFGRNREAVSVCLGEDDRTVSRVQGTLIHRENQWWIRHTSMSPLRLPQGRQLFKEQDLPLGGGYTPLFLLGSYGREHLLELFVTGPEHERPVARHRDLTVRRRVWRLNGTERLVLTVLAQRYLRNDAFPQPLAWTHVAEELAELGLPVPNVDRVVERVRMRLSKEGVAGLTRDEVGEPVGNALNHNLIQELLRSGALTPVDLDRLDPDFSDQPNEETTRSWVAPGRDGLTRE